MHDRSIQQLLIINLYLCWQILGRVLLQGHWGVLESLKCGGPCYHSEIVEKLNLSCVNATKAAECSVPLDLFFLDCNLRRSVIVPYLHGRHFGVVLLLLNYFEQVHVHLRQLLWNFFELHDRFDIFVHFELSCLRLTLSDLPFVIGLFQDWNLLDSGSALLVTMEAWSLLQEVSY